MIKISKEDVNIDTKGMPEGQARFIDNVKGLIVDVCNKAFAGVMSAGEVESQFKAINDRLKGLDGYAQLVKDNEALAEQLKKLGDSFEKMKKRGMTQGAVNRFSEKLDEVFSSEKWHDFVEGKSRKTGEFSGFSLKDVVSLTDDWSGTALLTQQSDRVVSRIAPKKVHVRDIVRTLGGDPQYPYLSFAEIYEMDRNARYVTENGRLPESSFKVREKQVGTKRLGTYLNISKRMLKSRVYLQSFILNMLPEAVWQAEDWNVLFGDGAGENLLGIVNTEGVTSVEATITSAVVEGAANSVKDVISYNGGKDTLVEFTDAQPLLLDGMAVTFAGAAVNTGLNATNQVVKLNDRQALLPGVAFKGKETATAAMTFTVNNAAFKSIEIPNSGDALNTAFAVMSYAQYTPTAVVLNPITLNAIASEKDTTGRDLGLVTVQNGVKYIGERPVIEYTGIPAGKYLVGDFDNGANLVDYTSLSLEFAEDVESKLTNQVTLIAQEEIILPVYNPWSFAYGDLKALKDAITKA